MVRSAIIAFLLIASIVLVLNTNAGIAGAREKVEVDSEELALILKNQDIILEKLATMDKKLDQLKMRIRY